jgi:hypothetical protein
MVHASLFLIRADSEEGKQSQKLVNDRFHAVSGEMSTSIYCINVE